MKNTEAKSFFIKLLCNKLSTAIPTQDLIECQVKSQQAYIAWYQVQPLGNQQCLNSMYMYQFLQYRIL